MDLPTMLKQFQEIRDSGPADLTINQASTLVAALVKHKRYDQCVELMRICQEHAVPLKPFARLKSLSVLRMKGEYELVLTVFNSLRREKDSDSTSWMFAGALEAATNLGRQDAVKDIFQQLLAFKKDEEKVEVGGEDVCQMLMDTQERGVKLSEFACQALVDFAKNPCQPDMALHVFSTMKEEGYKLTFVVYKSVLAACSGGKRWSDVTRVYEEMLVSQLDKVTLANVVMAYTQNEDEDVKLRGLDIFGQHKASWSLFACRAALTGLLQTGQFEVLLALANDMPRQGIKWDPVVHKLVALAHIRNGSTDKARSFLQANSKRLKGESAQCYHELIRHYDGGVKETSQLYLEMIHTSHKVSSADWCKALELALQLPDRTAYWKMRKLLRLATREVRYNVPEHLVLPNPDDSDQQTHWDTTMALKRFRDIQAADGEGLAVNVASKLLTTLANHDRVGDCVELWRYLEERDVFPKPFARAAYFNALTKAKKFDHALEMFKTLMHDGAPGAWAYTKALDAAANLKRHASVIEILRHMQEHEVKLTANDYTSITATCMREKEWTLALSMLSAMQKQGMNPPSSTFNLLLAGCGKNKFWNMMIGVYNGIPDDLRQLDGEALGAVLLAHSQAENAELQLRTVEVCNTHKTTCQPFPYNAAMSALLEANQYTEPGPNTHPSMCRSVVLAHIRRGSMQQARQLLDDNTGRMQNMSVECYRELIQYYAQVGDNLEASTMCVRMMKDNIDVNVDDWRTALQLALQLPDRAIYWELRTWLRLHGRIPLSEFREHLLLPEDNDQAASSQ
ncbi:Tetratricopeptide-like helical domain [Phytophthora cactorum]|nr:Tetratricopeptide-like helical domain [Phytophthora cactorum]